MFHKFCILFILTDLMCLGNPRNPVNISTNIEVEVVKPIEILFNTKSIYHSVFKNYSGTISNEIEIEVKASQNQIIVFSYESHIPLNDGRGNKIYIEWSHPRESFAGRPVGVGVREDAARHDSLKKMYHIPYTIYLTPANTWMPGTYRGVANFTINYS